MTADTYAPPFGAYTSVGPIGATPMAAIVAQLDKLKNLIPDVTTGVAVTYAPDFDEINPSTAVALRSEIAALRAVVTASITT